MTQFRNGIKSTPAGHFDVRLRSHVVHKIVVELSTSGAATTVSGGFPAWSRMVAAAAKVTTAVAGADATGFTVAIGGTTALTSSDLNVHPAVGGAIGWNPATSVETTATAADIVVTLTGGSDQTPTAGEITIDLVVEEFKS